MSTLYPRVVRMVREQPWAIEPEMLTLITDLVAFRAGGGRLTDESGVQQALRGTIGFRAQIRWQKTSRL